MIKIGIAGTGGMAEKRAYSFNGMYGVSIEGVYSRNLENTKKICQLTGAKGYDNFNNMLSVVDAVILCIPNSLHATFALNALTVGKHVLIEYPLCVTNKELNRLQEVSSISDYVLMTGNTIIHEAMFLFLMKYKKRLGNIISASSRVALYSKEITNAWYMNSLYLGPVFSGLHYHHIEYYRHFLGEVKWVMARNESIPNNRQSGYYTTTGGTLVMGHTDGASSCIQWYLINCGNGLPRCIWLNGTKSSITIVSQEEGKSRVIWDNGGEDKIEEYQDEWGVKGSCVDFIHAIRGKFNHKERLKSDIKTLKIGFAAEKSAKYGNIIKNLDNSVNKMGLKRKGRVLA